MTSESHTSEEQFQSIIADVTHLIIEGLDAGKYLVDLQSNDATQLTTVTFRDRILGNATIGKVMTAPVLTQAMIDESVSGADANYVLVSGTIADGVDVGRARSERIERMTAYTHYWAAFVFQGSIMVTVGTPPSSCRLIGEILNLQLPEPFVQSHICANCHTINPYSSAVCKKCSRPLSATGRLG